MDQQKRPPVIIITQVLVCFFAVALPIGDLFLVSPSFVSEILAEPTAASRLRLAIWPGGKFVLELAYLALTFYSLQKRKAYGRWLAVAGLALICILGLQTFVTTLLQSSGKPSPMTDQKREAESALEFIPYLAGMIILLIWLLFSAEVRAFFSQKILRGLSEEDGPGTD